MRGSFFGGRKQKREPAINPHNFRFPQAIRLPQYRLHVGAAIHGQHLAGNVVAVRNKERDGLGNLFR